MTRPAFHSISLEKLPVISIPIVTLLQNTIVWKDTNPSISTAHFRHPFCPFDISRRKSIHHPCGRPIDALMGIATRRENNDCSHVSPTIPISMMTPVTTLNVIIASISATSFVLYFCFIFFRFLLYGDCNIFILWINLRCKKTVVENYNSFIKIIDCISF